MNIGFIGLGQMGSRMVQNLLKASFDITVFDIRKEAAQQLLENGAKWMDTPKGIAESCEVVLSSLPGPPEVEDVVYGENGLMAGWKKGDIYIDMTTNSPTTIRKVHRDAEAKGVTVLDAPVSGGVVGAEAGTLSIMVGGNIETMEKVRDVLETIGAKEKILYAGGIGNGMVCKLVNNFILLGIGAVNAEGMVLGVKAGVEPKTLWQAVMASSGSNNRLERYPDTVFKAEFPPATFALALATKDVYQAHELSKDCGLSLPVVAGVAQDYREAKDAGRGKENSGTVILTLEEKAGVQVRASE